MARLKSKQTSAGAARLDVRCLAEQLGEIDRSLEETLKRGDSVKVVESNAAAELNAISDTLDALQSFLMSYDIRSDALKIMEVSLRALARGELVDSFKPQKRRGRKRTPAPVVALKGRLAGTAYAYMVWGDSRQQAIKRVAREIPSLIAQQISQKPIIASTIAEWMHQYGGSARVRSELQEVHNFEEFQGLAKANVNLNRRDYFGVFHCLFVYWNGCLMFAEEKPSAEWHKYLLHLALLEWFDFWFSIATGLLPASEIYLKEHLDLSPEEIKFLKLEWGFLRRDRSLSITPTSANPFIDLSFGPAQHLALGLLTPQQYEAGMSIRRIYTNYYERYRLNGRWGYREPERPVRSA
jgi:hypothetical protein